ncbi:hypothetical protein PpBr36_09032 [Pyricularia pennisetigena]|uniref:hypothetical protein n=1 Tax=Pyricularia pennisetigena TaxID=1578925 RepID=UPI00115128F6|nr:hypothetical protein PpBr36_09032 [Pyricularia pennisetigena]TLS23817.1 hypothetical protein PpBr36_09032 [Pyricularia pennisetigena]
MVSQSFLLRLAALCAVVNAAPLPLNINLGAYSPALVVGDGAIEFEGAAGKNGVESIINTLQGAAVAGGARAAAAAAEGATQPATASQAAAAQPAAQQQGLGLGAKAVEPSILNEKASLPLPGAAPLGPRSEEVEVEDEAEAEGDDEQSASAPLQKRQNAGFQAALNFAETALTKGPKIELGTHHAGVGIIVDNNAGAGRGVRSR